jgi:hypothetical protein
MALLIASAFRTRRPELELAPDAARDGFPQEAITFGIVLVVVRLCAFGISFIENGLEHNPCPPYL